MNFKVVVKQNIQGLFIISAISHILVLPKNKENSDRHFIDSVNASKMQNTICLMQIYKYFPNTSQCKQKKCNYFFPSLSIDSTNFSLRKIPAFSLKLRTPGFPLFSFMKPLKLVFQSTQIASFCHFLSVHEQHETLAVAVVVAGLVVDDGEVMAVV